MAKKLTEFQKGVKALVRAMRQGMRKTMQTTGEYFEEPDGKPAACALGAAWVDGKKLKEIRGSYVTYDDVAYEHPVIRTEPSGDNYYVEELGSKIINLNDSEGWKRERIAKWLEKLAKLPEAPATWDSV